MIGRIFLDQRVDSKCKNFYDSYGEICVKCNCCGRLNPKTMYACRLKVAKRMLKEDLAKVTHPDFQTELQQRNIRLNIVHFRRQIAYDKRRIHDQRNQEVSIAG